jgi:hypothetical protein
MARRPDSTNLSAVTAHVSEVLEQTESSAADYLGPVREAIITDAISKAEEIMGKRSSRTIRRANVAWTMKVREAQY